MAKPLYILRRADGTYCGSPLVNIAPNRNMSGTITVKSEALAIAAREGLTVEEFYTRQDVNA